MARTTYILGAGFSYPAGIPLQGQLMKEIVENTPDWQDLKESRRKLLEFIEVVFGLIAEDASHLALEDIYTPLHQALASQQYLCGYSPKELQTVEVHLTRLLSKIIDRGSYHGSPDFSYVDQFVETLLSRQRAHGPIPTVISLNWDILLDKRLGEFLQSHEQIDYCCDYSSFSGLMEQDEREERIMRRRWFQQKRIKLIKLHGSLGWVCCPQCQRLIGHHSKKIALGTFTGSEVCPFCKKARMRPIIALPSFRKELSSLHFQALWHAAGLELADSDKLVFIGYSFPLADFDLRSLVTRYVKTSAEVEVVLHSSDEGGRIEEQYRTYFGANRTQFHFCGVEEYILQHMQASQILQ